MCEIKINLSKQQLSTFVGKITVKSFCICLNKLCETQILNSTNAFICTFSFLCPLLYLLNLKCRSVSTLSALQNWHFLGNHYLHFYFQRSLWIELYFWFFGVHYYFQLSHFLKLSHIHCYLLFHWSPFLLTSGSFLLFSFHVLLFLFSSLSPFSLVSTLQLSSNMFGNSWAQHSPFLEIFNQQYNYSCTTDLILSILLCIVFSQSTVLMVQCKSSTTGYNILLLQHWKNVMLTLFIFLFSEIQFSCTFLSSLSNSYFAAWWRFESYSISAHPLLVMFPRKNVYFRTFHWTNKNNWNHV